MLRQMGDDMERQVVGYITVGAFSGDVTEIRRGRRPRGTGKNVSEHHRLQSLTRLKSHSRNGSSGGEKSWKVVIKEQDD